MNYSKFYTPPHIAALLVDSLDIDNPNEIVDICCGSCNLLLAAHERWPQSILYGVDVMENATEGIVFEKEDGRCYALDNTGRFDLVLANPPFVFVEEKNQFPELFKGCFEQYQTSRLEIEMLIANINLLRENGTLMIILPSSFVEAESYNKIRKIIAENYFVKKIVKLHIDTFGTSYINSYALEIIINNSCKKDTSFFVEESINNVHSICFKNSIPLKKMCSGDWIGTKSSISNKNIDIKRGNISSSSFITEGMPVLHTSKNSHIWKPAVRYVSKDVKTNIFAENGDIIVSRIGKSAGKWSVYHGDKVAISDCLFRIKDPNGEFAKRIEGKIYDYLIKGVATRYITMDDFISWAYTN